MAGDWSAATHRDAAPEGRRLDPTEPPVSAWPLALDTRDLGEPPPVPASVGMTPRQAATVEWSIIGLCALALVSIFQPFSLALFTVGAVLVVIGGLAFNLVPLCRPGVPARTLVKAGLIVLLLLFVLAGLAIGSAYLYGLYLQPR